MENKIIEFLINTKNIIPGPFGEIIKINGGRYAKYIWNQEGGQK